MSDNCDSWRPPFQRWRRCHQCWNLSPCCVCDGKRQAKQDEVELTGFQSILGNDAVDYNHIRRPSWINPPEPNYWQAAILPPEGRLSNIDDRADLSTLTADELEAMAYRAIYLDDTGTGS